MKPWLIVFLFTITLFKLNGQRYVFYLHGRIVETQGANAVDSVNGYGAYRYNDIIDSLKKRGFYVISEVRAKNTVEKQYAIRVVGQINELLNKGVKASAITVIGASKGAAIAMHVSTLAKNKDLNFVLMGACSLNNLERYPELDLYGNVLSIYEKSDTYGSCEDFSKKSTNITAFKEVVLNTGLRHGFIYQPLPAWLNPAVEWGMHGGRR